MGLPRTWTLSRWDNGLYDDYDIARGPSQIEAGEVRVIELNPLLDLLEGWLAPGGESDWSALTLEAETEALLSAHGRLKGSS